MDGRVSLHKLEVFCAVVEHGGVGRAADHLYVTQPVVSGHIRQLEARLGADLFRRVRQRLELTDAGHAAYTWARETLRRSTELDRELAGLTSGTGGAAAVATSMTVGSYLLPPILTDFARANPHARITVHVFDPDQIWEALTSGLCDLAVPIAPRIPYGRGLTGQLLGHQDLVLVVAPDAPHPAGDEIAPADLARLPFVSTPRGSIRRDLEDSALADLGITDRTVTIEFGHPEAIKHAVRAGLGVALLFHASVAADLADGTLRQVRIAGARPRLPVFAVVRATKHPTPLQRKLITTIAGALTA
ncbi:LysR family transcriptional regulator [Phytohabitans aurantiacus]|jgi:DNA-binding transcriptional LysR family regulator|uniref:LysR family transcriptional regulator n=1 Tax=Phytohabitans aurantiacus TaxID=3016789 RepID=A0ABQ5QKX8_9ACTN|nr:LysR family transcriptional regulator [Phytohabitans aurantiacus]GLH95333.1 LysR family transcriptional regulator [Phytohabitans aurantiacus]